MLPRNHPDRIQITFDDRRLVANAGLLLPATLARHLGLPELVRQGLDLGDAPGRANTSDKMMTLVASAPAGGDCIDDADSLLDGRCRRCGRDHLHPLPGRGGRRAGTAHRPAGEADARFPTGPLRQIQLSWLSSPTGTGSCSNRRLTIAATPRSRMPYATSSTASG